MISTVRSDDATEPNTEDLGVAALVRVVRPREPAVGLPDLALRGPPVHPKQPVVVVAAQVGRVLGGGV
jgi:hypothetical protein